jgi:hypothetical protein
MSTYHHLFMLIGYTDGGGGGQGSFINIFVQGIIFIFKVFKC